MLKFILLFGDIQWDKVHFSDERKFNLVDSGGRQYVRQKTGDRLNPRCVKKCQLWWRVCYGLGNFFI